MKLEEYKEFVIAEFDNMKYGNKLVPHCVFLGVLNLKPIK